MDLIYDIRLSEGLYTARTEVKKGNKAEQSDNNIIICMLLIDIIDISVSIDIYIFMIFY